MQNNIILFDFIPRHYVKVVTDDSAESRMLNVIMNILIITKIKSGDNSLGELLKECLLVNLVEETGWRANRQVAASSNTSNVAGGNLPTFGVMMP